MWWYYQGIIYWGLMPSNQTITSEVYCRQFDEVQKKLKKSYPSLVNRKDVFLLHENDLARASNMTQQKNSGLK